MNITGMIVSALLKKGVLGEFRQFETTVEIPQGTSSEKIVVKIKAENLQIRLQQNNGEETQSQKD